MKTSVRETARLDRQRKLAETLREKVRSLYVKDAPCMPSCLTIHDFVAVLTIHIYR
jgi:hypothetical protein